MNKNIEALSNQEIGIRIISRRKELGLTLKDVSNMVGVASSTIQRYEKGTISQLKLPVLESIAKAINVNPLWLINKNAPIELQENTLINEENILLSNFNKLNKEGKNEVSTLQSQLNEQLNVNAEYSSGLDSMTDLDEIYKIATTELGMVYSKPGQTVYYPQNSDDYVIQYKNVPETK